VIRAGLVTGAAVVVATAVLGSLRGEAGPTADWESAASMSQRRSYVATAKFDGSIYAAGGMVGGTGRPLTAFARYQPEVDAWEVLPPLTVPTRAAAAAAMDGTIYVTGGTTPSGNSRAVWAYDLEARSWQARRPLPTARYNHSAVALGGRLYVLGGIANGRERADVLVYDAAADAWRTGPRLPGPMHAFGTVQFRGELWVLGGRRRGSLLRETWILNPRRLTWKRGPDLPRGIELLGAAVEHDEIHVVWESTYLVYDASEHAWLRGPGLRIPRHALAAYVLQGSLYAIGGCTTKLEDSSVVERLSLDGALRPQYSPLGDGQSEPRELRGRVSNDQTAWRWKSTRRSE